MAVILTLALVLTLLPAGVSFADGGALQVKALETEYAENPIGIDRQDPVFSWKIEKGTDRGVMQASYRVLVAASEAGFAAPLWDSGVVASDRSNGIVYEGPALQAATKYYWKVEATDNFGDTDVSDVASFAMGLLAESDWGGAKWISNIGGTPEDLGDVADPEVFFIEAEFELEQGSFGLMFGADTNNFNYWQINTVQSELKIGVKQLLLRPHAWVGGGASVLGEYVIGDADAVDALTTGTHTLKILVDHGKVYTELDGAELSYATGYGTTPGISENYLTIANNKEMAGIGVRVSNTTDDKDKLKIDSLVMKDSLGKPVYYDDFTGANTLTGGTVTDGKLAFDATGPGEQRCWQKADDSQVYSVLTDVRIGNESAGLIFGAKDSSHFLMWQLNTLNHPGYTYLRPHIWNPGGAVTGGELNIDSTLSAADAEGQMNRMQLDVNGAAVTTYINGTNVDTRNVALTGRGGLGFRHSKAAGSTNPEQGIFDNVMQRDTGGRVLVFDDFENGVNRYGNGEIVNGQMVMTQGEVVLRNNDSSSGGATTEVAVVRKEFRTEDKEIERATLYASALGHYEFQLNGEKAGEDYMAPGWTEYGKRVQYQSYDVTAMLEKDEDNAIGGMLAPGWYSGNISNLGKNKYGTERALLANLVIEYADGSTQEVVTDDTWTYTANGPIRATDMQDGETYDANKEFDGEKYGYTKVGFDDSKWGTVAEKFSAWQAKTGASGGAAITLSAQIGPTVKAVEEVTPVSVELVEGKYIVDMGQNFAGIAELSLKGQQGETAIIRYGEMLNDDSGTGDGNEGTLYTRNMRSAKVTDRYVFKSDAKETWTPTFTFHGFRYIEIANVSEAPALTDIKGIALASAMEETGTFESSDATLNKIYENVLWGQRSNFLSVPTDCPQRDERMGWGADTMVFAKTGMYNMDAAMFYQKWLQDARDGQHSNGSYPDTSPNPHGFGGDIVWSAGGVVVPYQLWQMTGDTRILSDGYTSMKSYMAFRANQGTLQSCSYGDWLDIPANSHNKEVVGTTYYAYQLTMMAEIADALGNTADADAYRARYETVKAAFLTKHVDAAGKMTGNYQSSYVLALGTGLTTPELEPLMVQNLVDAISANGEKMSVGFVSVNMLMPVLTKYGHADVAYHLAMTKEYPSWGYSIEQGATTIWERWNSYTKENGFGDASMNSFNHYSFGSVVSWFYNGIAGIDYDPANPGFKNVLIKPTFDTRVASAKASYDSVRGTVATDWTMNASTKQVNLKVNVPAGATATVELPTTTDSLKEGGTPITETITGIKAVTPDAASGTVSLDIGSGEYAFTFAWDAPASKTAFRAAISAAKLKAEIEEDFTLASVTDLKAQIVLAQAVLDDDAATQEEVDEATDDLNDKVGALQPGGNTNLALGKTATASDAISGWPPSHLTDGTRSGGGVTTYSSNILAEYTNQWILLDLGSTQTFNRLLIFPRNDGAPSGYGFPRAFTLEASDDNETWTPLVAKSDYPYAGTTPQRFTVLGDGDGITARYIRMSVTRLNPNPGDGNNPRIQLAEFEVYNIGGAEVDKRELELLINEAEQLSVEDYIPATWIPFAAALTAAKLKYADTTSTGADISTAYTTLNTAMAGLVKTPIAISPNWVWDDKTGTTPINTWMAFRKTVNLAEAPTGEVIASIAADSKYWLYINGELALFEGSLKRGPTPEDTYVDKFDIGPYLKAGDNTIAVLVQHFGKSGSYSHTNSGHGGLYFDATAGSERIFTNQEWKVKELTEWGLSAKTLNYRLPESNIRYDAQVESTGWQQPAFDDDAWADATVYGRQGVSPWNDFVDRPVPFLKYDEDYRVFDEDNTTATETTVPAGIDTIPVNEFIIKTKFRESDAKGNAAFGVVFGYRDSSNLNMWQVYVKNAVHGVADNPYLKPHIKVNGGWDTPMPNPVFSWISKADALTHDYDVEIRVEGGQAITTVDGNLVDTRAVTLYGGGVGFRADAQEQGIVESFKVTSLDGETVYIDDDFQHGLNLDRGDIVDGKFVFGGTNNDVAVFVKTEKTTRYECSLPVNVQLTPYLKVDSDVAGKVISIYTDKTNVADGPASQAEYVTKAGEQSFESLAWLNGEKLYFEVPEGVEVLELGYRQSGSNADFEGSFTSDDEFMNTLWTKARDTLYVTMRDNYMDCPDRERAQWWGDAVNEMQMAWYSLSTDSNDLAKKGIYNVLGYAQSDGHLPTVAPIGNAWNEIPAQVMAGIMSYYMYYEYTGDDSVLYDTYLPSYKYLMLFSMKADGTVANLSTGWGTWCDWGSGSDVSLIYNAWYYIALDRTIKSAQVIGIPDDSPQVKEMKSRMASIKANFDALFWKPSENVYRTTTATVDDRGNALAVFAGLVPESRYPAMKSVLTTVKNASPYMEKYVLEALYQMGYEKEAMTRIKDRYGVMVNSPLTTLWEFWDPNSGTQNHAWTGGPLTMMSMYAAGVSPVDPGYEKFKVAPQLGTMNEIDAKVPTVKGEINVKVERKGSGDNETIDVWTNVPSGTTALIGVPKIGGDTASKVKLGDVVIWEKGADVAGAALASVDQDSRFVYYESTTAITLTAAKDPTSTLSLDVDDRGNMAAYVDGTRVTFPYSAIFRKDSDVDIRFESAKYADEYGIDGLDGIALEDEKALSYSLTMSEDYDLKGHVVYVGPVNIAKSKAVAVTNAMTGATDATWGANNLVDGIRTGITGKAGFTTGLWNSPNISATPQLITIDLGRVLLVDRVYLYPRTDAVTALGTHPNFPEDFNIQVSTDGVGYTTVKTVTGYTVPEGLRGEFILDDLTEARYVRIETTKLGMSAADESANYRVQLAEIEIYEDARPAQEIADSITSIAPIDTDQTAIALPDVPVGFEVKIKSSTNTDIIGMDGTLILPEEEEQVTIVFTVTKVSDGTTYDTEAITVTAPAAPLVPVNIVVQPQDQWTPEGEAATISLVAEGSYMSYQWQIKEGSTWSDLAGATGPSYTTGILKLSDNGRLYRCVVTNKGGSVTSSEAAAGVLRVLADPAEVAGNITTATAIQQGQDELYLPGVPVGYTIAIKSSSDTSVIALDGSITPVYKDRTVSLVFEVTKTLDGTTALTAPISVTVPGTITAEPNTAFEVAESITLPLMVTSDSTELPMPAVPDDFAVFVYSVSPSGIIGDDGSVVPPARDTDVEVTFIVVDTVHNTSAITAPVSVTVRAKTKFKLEGIALNPGHLSLSEGDSGKLEVSFYPINTTDAKGVSYSVQPAGVLSVAADGSYTALKAGSAVVTATSSVGGYEAYATVVVQAKAGGDQQQAPGDQTPQTPTDTDKKDTVTAEPVTKLLTPLKQIIIAVKAKVTLPVVAYDKNGAIQAKLSWTSSNTAVAAVGADTGKVTAKKTGTAKITAKAQNGKSVTITVKVVKKAKAIKKISLVKPPKSLKKGKTAQLKVKVLPATATYKSIVFRSSKPSVVSVDKAGMLTAKKKGKATITVKMGNRFVTHKVTVK
jgi:uncharacterized protein YjdB